jgi:hypothetical protein
VNNISQNKKSITKYFFGGAFVLNFAQDNKCLGHKKMKKPTPKKKIK